MQRIRGYPLYPISLDVLPERAGPKIKDGLPKESSLRCRSRVGRVQVDRSMREILVRGDARVYTYGKEELAGDFEWLT